MAAALQRWVTERWSRCSRKRDACEETKLFSPGRKAGVFCWYDAERMTLILTRDQVREVDRRAISEYGISGLVLMENAGRGTADVLCGLIASSQGSNERVVIVCGKGNNGGDGFVIARHLDLRGIAVRVLLLADPKELTGDAATNYQIIEKAGLRIVPFAAAELAGATWLVDAILGTGASGEPKSPLAEAIDCYERQRRADSRR